MKNVILGIIGIFIVIYTVLISLSIYSVQSRKNELENCLSQVVEYVLEENYRPKEMLYGTGIPKSNEEIAKEIEKLIRMRISSDTMVDVYILECDMEKGILSVRIEETYILPNGKIRTDSYAKTAIIDRVLEDETSAKDRRFY